MRKRGSRSKSSAALRGVAPALGDFINALTEGVVIRSADGTLLDVNRAALRLLGLEREHLSGASDLPPGWTRTGSGRALWLAPTMPDDLSPVVSQLEFIDHPDGRRTWLSVSRRALHDDTGASVAMSVVTLADTSALHAHQQRELDRARLHGLDARMNDVELVMRLDGTLVHANDKALACYGYALDEMLALNITDLRAEQSRGLIPTQMGIAWTEGIRFETEHRRRDGTIFPVEVSSRGFSVAGQPHLHSLVRDLTDAHRAEAERRLLADLVTRMSDAVIVANADLEITEYAGASERIYGWSRNEVIGKSLATDFVKTFSMGDADEVRRRLAVGEEVSTQVKARRRDGAWIDLDLVATPLRDARGRLTGWLSVARDISAHVASVSALRKTEERLAWVLEGSNVGFWDWDIPSGRVLFSNRWVAQLGYAPSEIEPHILALKRLMHPDDLAEAWAEFDRHARGETTFLRDEYRLRHKDGRWIWVVARGAIVERDASGAPVRMTGTHADVSAQKCAEQALVESEQRYRALAEELREALDSVKVLTEFLPICMFCKKVRDDAGYWARIDEYISTHTGTKFSHGLCPDCAREHYPDQTGGAGA